MPLFSKTDPGELVLILDVQSSVVRGTLAILKQDAHPSVVFAYNSNIPFKPHTDSTYLIKMTLRAIEETVEAVERDLNIRKAEKNADHMPRRISAVHYVLSSPWIVSQAKEFTTTFPKAIHVTSSYISDLIKEERDKLIAASAEPVKVIEEKVFDVRLNGYSVAAWEGKETTDLKVTFTDSIAGARMVERFLESASRIARPRNIFFHSSLLLQYIGLSSVFPEKDNFTLLHIHGELTDLAVIRNRSCAFFGSFPFGVRSFVRKVAAAANVDMQTADSLLTLYTGDHLDETHGKDTLASVGQIAEGWQNDLKKIFAGSGLELPPPLAILLSAWAHDDFFAKILRGTYVKIHVDMLSIEDIASHVSFNARIERRRLTGLYAIAVHHMRYEGSVI